MGIMQHMGFVDKWIQWISLCMMTVNYSFIVSGRELGPIIPPRRLRQGDLISPYLFLLCAEGLSALIQRKQELGVLHGCKIASNAPIIIHLFFADDCYLFFRETLSDVKGIQDCLQLYEKATGQQVNYQKSCIHFSRNTESKMADLIQQKLQVQLSDGSAPYLGLPSSVGKQVGGVPTC